MKIFTLFGLLTVLLLAGCREEKAEKELREFKEYVKAQRDSVNEEANIDWDKVERDYKEKRAKLENNLEKLDDKMKAELDSLDREYEETKEKYKARRRANDND